MDIHSLLGTKLVSVRFHPLFRKRSQTYNCMDPQMESFSSTLTRSL
jgi:hypothetical protein